MVNENTKQSKVKNKLKIIGNFESKKGEKRKIEPKNKNPKKRKNSIIARRI